MQFAINSEDVAHIFSNVKETLYGWFSAPIFLESDHQYLIGDMMLKSMHLELKVIAEWVKMINDKW